jgi:hypothetical protein
MVVAWVSGIGSALQLVGVATVAADLIHHGRVPDVRGTLRRLLRRSRSVHLQGAAHASARITGTATGVAGPARVEIGRGGDVEEQMLELERRIGEVQASVEREGRSRAEAIARLERGTQQQMQSLQNELTALRHDLARDRERVKSRAGIGWAGIAGFSLGLILNIVGAFMAVGCTA